ncbi:hypothetical protein H0H92_007313 [Tricholoma furcatifolium]|nr:hypothetical protein H0H92_007313 [Tricholoma furcatifolium]
MPDDADDEGEDEEELEEETEAPPEDEAEEVNDNEYVELIAYENEYYSCESDGEQLFALTEAPEEDNSSGNKVRMRKVRILTTKESMTRPIYRSEDKECLATWEEINGVQAWTLWDSGSTTSGVTPAFAQVAKMRVSPLENPITLQLGTIRSRSIVNYGAMAAMRTAGFVGEMYVDIANFDRYDCILGTPFMHQNKVVLDFDKKRVVVNGVAIPATAVEIGDNDGRLRRTKRPTVEDVVEVVQAVDSLPSSVEALLITEEEYQATLLEGEKVGPPTEKVEKILVKNVEKKKILVEKTEFPEKLKEKGTAGVHFTPAQELKSSSK